MNKYRDHIYVIPEDDANRQIAVGFVNHHRVKDSWIRVMPVAGGWRNVLEVFTKEYIRTLQNYSMAHVVMLIDFDGSFDQRRAEFENAIPANLRPRVFVLGSKDTPETLKNESNMSFERIGESLADDCDAGTTKLWGHAQLNHNEPDRQRLDQTVKPFLF